MYQPELGFKPRVSRLEYEHSTTELSEPTQFCDLNLGFFLTTIISIVSRVVYSLKAIPRVRGCGRGTCGVGEVHVCRLLHNKHI